MRGQLSVEMLILIALVLGLVFIVYTSLTNSAQKAAGAVGNNTETLTRASVKCFSADDCSRAGAGTRCDTATNTCS